MVFWFSFPFALHHTTDIICIWPKLLYKQYQLLVFLRNADKMMGNKRIVKMRRIIFDSRLFAHLKPLSTAPDVLDPHGGIPESWSIWCAPV